MRVRIIASREVHLWVEPVLPKLLEAWLTKRKPCIDNFDVAVVQRILHNCLVLFYSQSAGRINNVTAGGAVGIHDVDGR